MSYKPQKGKSKSKCTTQVVTKVESLQTEADHLILLRGALRDQFGDDRDVLDEFKKITTYKKNDMEISMHFQASPLPRDLFLFCYGLSKTNLQKLYDDSGYGWEDDEKKEELREDSGRFIMLRDDKQDGKLVGYASFRFSLQGEVVNAMEGSPALLVFDLQLLPEVQRKGLGKYVMMILELVAKRQKMVYMMVPLVKGNPAGSNFFTQKLAGYKKDKTYGEDDVQIILSKSLKPKKKKKAAAPKATTEKKTEATEKKAEVTEKKTEAVVKLAEALKETNIAD